MQAGKFGGYKVCLLNHKTPYTALKLISQSTNRMHWLSIVSLPLAVCWSTFQCVYLMQNCTALCEVFLMHAGNMLHRDIEHVNIKTLRKPTKSPLKISVVTPYWGQMLLTSILFFRKKKVVEVDESCDQLVIIKTDDTVKKWGLLYKMISIWAPE